MCDNKTIIKLPNSKTDIQWTSYLATAYAEGFCEGEGANQEQQLEAWAYLIMTKIAYSLQGWFGRNAITLVESEFIDENGTINWDRISEYDT